MLWKKLSDHSYFHFLDSTLVFEPFQSDCAVYHSTETALLNVMNDLLLAVDLSDTVDHDIILSCLGHWVDIKALSWFKSYLKSRTLSVAIDQFLSLVGFLKGPFWDPYFLIYMLPLGYIIRKYKISFNFYADDSQLYVPLKSRHSLQSLMDCLKDIKSWMVNTFLQLNNEKLDYFWSL